MDRLAFRVEKDTKQVHDSLVVGDFLRSATRGDHDRVDAAFARFELDDLDQYRRFIRAQARALLAVEAALDGAGPIDWTPREALIADDLAALGEVLPEPLYLAPPATTAQAWGMLYVLEGSRLGGAVLVDQIATQAPRAYLGAVHRKGEWRRFRERLGEAGAGGGDRWLDEALKGARAAFGAFLEAAEAA